ncbi:MAG: putative quinol monooxygenase [Acidimicrobiales bacterium]
MIIVTARLVFATREARDKAVEGSIPVQAATRDEEPGCEMYCFAADPAVPTEIQVYELWTDADSLEQHFTHPNYAAMVEVLHGVEGFVESVNRQYVADDRGTVYDENKAPRIAALKS